MGFVGCVDAIGPLGLPKDHMPFGVSCGFSDVMKDGVDGLNWNNGLAFDATSPFSSCVLVTLGVTPFTVGSRASLVEPVWSGRKRLSPSFAADPSLSELSSITSPCVWA